MKKLAPVSILFILIVCNLSIADEQATFAGGCYWCMEEAMEKVPGVHTVTSGFASGIEAVQLTFDPAQISYEKLLDSFWKNVDPTDGEGQFCDRGARYQSAIFYANAGQKSAAEKSKEEIAKVLGKSIATQVVELKDFSPVAESEQDYYKKHVYEYKQYKMRCGRSRRLGSIWK